MVIGRIGIDIVIMPYLSALPNLCLSSTGRGNDGRGGGPKGLIVASDAPRTESLCNIRSNCSRTNDKTATLVDRGPVHSRARSSLELIRHREGRWVGGGAAIARATEAFLKILVHHCLGRLGHVLDILAKRVINDRKCHKRSDVWQVGFQWR
jgi:hypothetical protein